MGKTLVGTEESAGTVTEGVLQIRFFENCAKFTVVSLMKFQVLGPATLLKGDPSKGVFLRSF